MIVRDTIASSNSKTLHKHMGSKQFTTEFVGSFFDMTQLPKDRLPQVAVAGRSNVGKSSLLNRMLGQRKLAKVSSTPGKTRSLNFFKVDNRFHVVDLPGYGYAKVAKSVKASWGKLIEEYLTKSPELKGLILLMDCRREPTPEDLQLLEWLAARDLSALMVLTKCDKVNRDHINRKIKLVENELGLSAVPFSTVTGLGKRELISSLLDLIESKDDKAKEVIDE